MRKLNNIQYILLIITFSFFYYSCDNLLCDSENSVPTDSLKTEEILRFNQIETPIEGKLLFVAGPTPETENDSFYNPQPWDFWKLEGTEFTNLNEIPWPYSWSTYWNYQYSPHGSYFSFFDDKSGPIMNTDDIGLLNLANFTEYYFTDSLGDANPSDEWIYQWDSNEEFIYFNAIQYGVSEYDTLANSDLYRVTPNNYLEKLTDTPFFEAAVNPGPNGKYLAYFVEKRFNVSPDSLVGLHLLNLETMKSEMIYSILANNPDKVTAYPHFTLKWNTSGDYFIVKMPDGAFFKYEISTDTIEHITNINFKMLFFVPNSNKLMVTGLNNSTDKRELGIFDLENETLTFFPIDIDNYAQNPWDPPTLSPSGRYLAFTAYIDDGMEVVRNQYVLMHTNIFILDLSDYSVTQVTTGWSGYEGYLKWVE